MATKREDVAPEKPSPGRGRPRSEAATVALLGAAYDLTARHGLKGATIEAIAKETGVSKVTIYKWWDDRGALLTDAFLWRIGLEVPLNENDDPVQAIHGHAAAYVKQLHGDMGRVLKALLSECLTKSGNVAVFCERYLNERRELGARVIAAGQKTGAIKSTSSPLFLYDQIYGTIFYRFLFDFPGLTPSFVRELIDATFGR